MIAIDDVTRVYGSGAGRTHALCGVSERIERGEWVALVGPSGSGKTTLLNIVGCLDRPTSGTVTFEGRDLFASGDRELTRFRAESLGFVFQTFNLFGLLTAVENVEYPLHLLGVARGERRRRALEALQLVGLQERADRLPGRLSGGEQQRVAIARAVVHRPRLILADEPTANLDSTTGAGVIELLGGLNERLGLTLVVATHDESILRHAGRVVMVRDGRVVEGGTG